MTIPTASASSAGGHTQPSTSCTDEPNTTRSRPPSPMNRAGAAAQRCGWSVKRIDSTASIAQPIANPHRRAPVRALSSAGMNGAAARSEGGDEAGGQRAGHDPRKVAAAHGRASPPPCACAGADCVVVLFTTFLSRRERQVGSPRVTAELDVRSANPG